MTSRSRAHSRISSVLRRAGLRDVPLPVVACIAVLCLALIAFALWRFWPASQSDDYALAQNASESVAAEVAATESDRVVVDVEGCVKSPGLKTLEAPARVGDAIAAAGGFAANVDKRSVNLAAPVCDGEQIYVASKSESGTTSASSSSSSESGTELVNINTADADELQKLPGIGETFAQRIIDYREKNGRFGKKEDLKNVSGVGDGRFDALKDAICV